MPMPEPAGPTTPSARDDPSLALLCSLALARLRTGLPVWTTLAPPLAVTALLAVAVSGAGRGHGAVWDHWLGLALYLWAVLAPMLAGLYAVGCDQADEGAKRVVSTYAFPRHRLLIADVLALTALWAAGALLLAALVSLAALANGTPADAGTAVAGAFVPVLAALPTLVLCVIAAEAWGAAGATCVGVAGMLFGALTGDKPYWWVFPPAWPTRAVIPVAETRGLGGYYAPGDPVLSPSVLPVIAVAALALSAVLLAAGSRYVDRREM
ncbi:hypothetical protein CLV63_102354 [Murinocardiopsis flavida]|uniref:ABC-2 type transport system permease protein n=1 Tax=Murinocardiopsis flavida TaxID=645275 RepID=A0A2P8DSN3_9ACTN|nr:hypothetical protein [Murinocardiopsis flavida]PSL00227.1 hypothetical protein CLV63_102354 [Murinocardiopsis flavida]